jgi:hypothetical protein
MFKLREWYGEYIEYTYDRSRSTMYPRYRMSLWTDGSKYYIKIGNYFYDHYTVWESIRIHKITMRIWMFITLYYFESIIGMIEKYNEHSETTVQWVSSISANGTR